MDDRRSYPTSLRALHWLIAAAIFSALVLGVWAIYTPRGAFRSELLEFHKSFGITALALVVLRIPTRAATTAPNYVPPLGRMNKLIAGGVHLLLYALMLAMPISGYIHSMAGGHGFDWFGLFPVPDFLAHNKSLEANAGRLHYLFAWTLGALLALHLLDAGWHWLRGDGVVQRMWRGAPGGGRAQPAKA